jgi:hypothetical protein
MFRVGEKSKHSPAVCDSARQIEQDVRAMAGEAHTWNGGE